MFIIVSNIKFKIIVVCCNNFLKNEKVNTFIVVCVSDLQRFSEKECKLCSGNQIINDESRVSIELCGMFILTDMKRDSCITTSDYKVSILKFTR